MNSNQVITANTTATFRTTYSRLIVERICCINWQMTFGIFLKTLFRAIYCILIREKKKNQHKDIFFHKYQVWIDCTITKGTPICIAYHFNKILRKKKREKKEIIKMMMTPLLFFFFFLKLYHFAYILIYKLFKQKQISSCYRAIRHIPFVPCIQHNQAKS